jgi:flavin-dependent dehydrogenase
MKVIIIGASTPGLFAAYLLAREGVEVEVYERAHALRGLQRTLIVTDKLKDVLGFAPDEAILNEVRYVEMFSKSRSTRLELERPDLIVERENLVRLLARLAEAAGARVLLGHRFLAFVRLGNKIAVELSTHRAAPPVYASADILVGADGTFSAVARAASRNGHHHTALIQAKVELPAHVNRHTYQVWFDPGRTKYFYWLIPESEQVAAVGLIADDARQAGDNLKLFLQERGLQPLDYQAAMVPMHRFGYGASISSIERNVFLIGDAAAQVKLTTVGGVVTGLRGAQALAETVLNKPTARRAVRALKRELDLHLFLRRLLDQFSDADYDRLIDWLDGDLSRLLSTRTRDELAHTFVKLIIAEPRLVGLGAKALLRAIRV